jgi:hypothetical protein
MLRLGIGLGVLAVFSLFVFSLGNKHGSNSRELARYRDEIQKTNAKLQKFESEDARDAIAAEDRAAAEDAEFARVVPTLGKCLLTPSQAAALNKIGGAND